MWAEGRGGWRDARGLPGPEEAAGVLAWDLMAQVCRLLWVSVPFLLLVENLFCPEAFQQGSRKEKQLLFPLDIRIRVTLQGPLCKETATPRLFLSCGDVIALSLADRLHRLVLPAPPCFPCPGD